jgi:hypothetical protein
MNPGWEAVMTKQVIVPVLRAVGRAILGAFAGMCIGVFPGTLVLVFILHVVLHPYFGSPAQGERNLYFTISAMMGAVTGAILGITIGEKEISGGEKKITSGARRKLFHPLGMLIGLICGATLGATFASLFVYSPNQSDAHDSLIITCSAAIIGGVGGGLLGPTGWTMIGGAMAGWLIVGIGFVVAYHHIKGMIYGALFGAPLGALFGFVHGLRLEESAKRPKPKVAESSLPVGVWDREFDS